MTPTKGDREKARELVQKLRLGIMASPDVITATTDWRVTELAQALADQREKDAKIAESKIPSPLGNRTMNWVEIATVIRRGEP